MEKCQLKRNKRVECIQLGEIGIKGGELFLLIDQLI